MDRVIPADAEAIPVSGDNPDAQLRTRGLQPGGDRGCAAMDGVHPVGVHVIRKPATATDAGNNDDVLAGDSEGRHYLLYLCENGIISAARAPANFLIGGKVLRGQGGRDRS